MHKDLPLVKSLAEHLIEHELGVKSEHTIWREHLYELAGFHVLFDAVTVSKLKAGTEVPLETLPPLPNLSIRLRDVP